MNTDDHGTSRRRPADPPLRRRPGRGVRGRAGDAVLAAARPPAGGRDPQPAVPVPRAAAAGDRGRARGVLRGRPRPADAGDPGRAQRLQRGAARAVRRHRRRGAGVLPADPRRPGVRPRLRLRARLHVAVRVGAGDRRGRPVAAVPDARLRLGRDGRRAAAAPRHRTERDRDAGGVRRGVGVRLRPADEPLGLAVRPRDRGARPRGLAGLRRRCPAGGEPPALRGLHPADLDGQLRHRPRDHHRRGHRGPRPGGAHDVAPRVPPGVDQPLPTNASGG